MAAAATAAGRRGGWVTGATTAHGRWESVAGELGGRPQSPPHSASGNKCRLALGPPVSRILCLWAYRGLRHSQSRGSTSGNGGEVEEHSLSLAFLPAWPPSVSLKPLSWISRLLNVLLAFHSDALLNRLNANQETTSIMTTINGKGK